MAWENRPTSWSAIGAHRWLPGGGGGGLGGGDGGGGGGWHFSAKHLSHGAPSAT